MGQRCRRLHLVLGVLASAGTVWGADAPARAIRPPRFDQAPIIDGRLDDAVWASAARLDGFQQVQPGDNLEPSQRTEVLVGYDQRALYLGFRAEDSSGHVRATIARRDAIEQDDVVGVYLDTFRDRQRAYYVFFNPYGVQADGIYTEGKADPDLTVDLVLESKGTVDATGYTVEAAIPFASLRYRSGESPVWGLHVQRFIRRETNEQISWMPLSRDRSSLLDQAGQLGAFEDVGEGRPLEIIPTAIVLDEASARAEPGITANLGLTPTMNATFTANPDFAQVEADQLILTLNQRFPILYEEKRPFFLEGADAFQTPITILHTRTIVDPDYAMKVTGTQGRTTIGALYASDGGTKTAFRLRRAVRHDSTIGATATGVYDGGVRPSTLVSADARLRLDPRTVATAQLAGTPGRGLAYYGSVERKGRHGVFALTGSGASPDYRAELGFTRRVNTNALSLQTTYKSEPRPDGWLISWTATHVGLVQWNWQGRTTLVYVYPQAQLNFRRQTYLRAYAFRDYERVFGSEFAGGLHGSGERATVWKGYVLQAGSGPTEALAFSVTLAGTWDVFDYDLGGGPRFPRVSPAALADPDAALDPGPARARGVGGDVTWRPVDALRTSVEASRSTLVRNDTGRTAYDATLVSWRTTYQFTRFAFLRLRTDWDSAARTRRGQYLFGWTPSPGTSVYAGYTDAETGPSFFVKVSFLIRKLV